MKVIASIAVVILLGGCAGRSEPEGSFLDPVCMADGSVAWRQLADDKGAFATPKATKANCPWNKTAAK